MEQNNNDLVHVDAEYFENLRQQVAATQAENANLRAQLVEANERENVDADNQTGLEQELSRAEKERDALQQENAAFNRLFEGSRAQIAQQQMEQMPPEQLLQLIINLDVEGRHWHQRLHQHLQDCDDHIYQVQEYYMNEIAQIQQSHAGQIEDFHQQTAELYHEMGHMLAQLNGLRFPLRNDRLRWALQTVEGERENAISEGMVLRGENEALQEEVAQLRSENQKRLALGLQM
jgi:hypothetical protein